MLPCLLTRRKAGTHVCCERRRSAAVAGFGESDWRINACGGNESGVGKDCVDLPACLQMAHYEIGSFTHVELWNENDLTNKALVGTKQGRIA
jgi:hypothetical protein